MRALTRYSGSSVPTAGNSEFTSDPPSFWRRRDAITAGRVLLLVPLRPVDVDLFAVDLEGRAGLPRRRHQQLLSLDERLAPLRRGRRPRAERRAVKHAHERRPVTAERDFRPPGPDEDRHRAGLHLELLV